MARPHLTGVVATSALLLAAVVVSLCSPGAGAARQLVAGTMTGRETTAAVAVAAAASLAATTRGPLPQVQVEMAALQVVPGDNVAAGAGGDGSVAVSKRLSPGGPDPQHH